MKKIILLLAMFLYASVNLVCAANLIFASVIFAAPKEHPSFDCNKTNAAIDKVICESPKLMKLDRELAKNFQIAKNTLPLDKQKQLLLEQREWLKTRVQSCTVDVGKKYESILSDCLQTEYEKRNYQLLNENKVINDQTLFDITGSIDFADFKVHGKVNITPQFLEKLSYAKINGNGQFPEGLKSSDGKNMIKNCHDFWQYPLISSTTYDMAMSSYFDITCGILTKLKNIKQPKKSFIQGIYLSNADVLPLHIFGIVSNEDEKELNDYTKQGVTMHDLIASKKISFTKRSNYSIWLESESMRTRVDEITRGDFDGDGLEEILVTIYNHVNNGTLFYNKLCILSKDANDKQLIIKKCYSVG